MKAFLKDLWKVVALSFSGKNIFAHFAAMGVTASVVLSGFDWYYFSHVNAFALEGFFFPAVIIGAFVPILFPLYFIVSAQNRRDGNAHSRWNLGIALATSAISGSIISSFYKALTGRIQPSHTDLFTDISRQFNFGFWEHGIFWGWPSSHTTIAFAMAFTLISLFPKNRLLVICSFLYALYIGVGISMSIHWFSEFAAGAIIGIIIGLSTGAIFKRKFGK